MKIFIAGLGLIGASYAEKLTEKGHTVTGFDPHGPTLEKAKAVQIINPGSSLSDISSADMVIIAMNPEDTVRFIKDNHHRFTPAQTLTDVCGVKRRLLNRLEEILPAPLHYTSHHPMAGKETRGIDARDKDLFNEANFLIVKTDRRGEKDIRNLETIAGDLGFARISILTPQEHDRFIAYTSQLTHVIASCLINSAVDDKAAHSTGNSFKDLTRIAKINAPLWRELFLNNKTDLLKTIRALKDELTLFETLISEDDSEGIENYLNRAKKRRESYD